MQVQNAIDAIHAIRHTNHTYNLADNFEEYLNKYESLTDLLIILNDLKHNYAVLAPLKKHLLVYEKCNHGSEIKALQRFTNEGLSIIKETHHIDFFTSSAFGDFLLQRLKLDKKWQSTITKNLIDVQIAYKGMRLSDNPSLETLLKKLDPCVSCYETASLLKEKQHNADYTVKIELRGDTIINLFHEFEEWLDTMQKEEPKHYRSYQNLSFLTSLITSWTSWGGSFFHQENGKEQSSDEGKSYDLSS